VTVPASRGRRKTRLVRDEPPPDDTVVMLRAAGADPTRTLRNIALDARESSDTYVIERSDGRREILYGISVYAQRHGVEPGDVLARFTHAPHYVAVPVGAIRGASFDVIATGTNLDHYDIQLIPGRFDAGSPEATDEEVRAAAARFLWAAGSLTPNPAYAGDLEDDR
jgi:hypothetical protein